MKLNHFNSTSTVLHKSVEVALLIILSFQLQATAINLDSLKHVLKTSDNPQDNCPLLFELYKHYKTTEQVDSMNVYAKNCLKECILCKKEGFPVVSTVIYGQFRQGFVSNISPVAEPSRNSHKKH